MVGIVGRDDRFEAQLQHHQKHHLSHQRARAHDSQALTTSPAIASQYPNHPYDYSYHHRTSAPQSPPSPPGEDTIKPSLPSISSLLGMTEGEFPPASSLAVERAKYGYKKATKASRRCSSSSRHPQSRLMLNSQYKTQITVRSPSLTRRMRQLLLATAPKWHCLQRRPWDQTW